ncbi:MAG TPA: energy-coupling factor transporter ATPase [Bacillota bacterium]|jgi:energy-coupling factor transport system ATP-binding protein|nr:energy-coupling factor transporter ATPase [Clostridiales bacterium UBA9856]HOA42310.1 energy-coupling factor transporter ATPase [Bacillota bacterium]HQC82216.1 energy-coupling factor transporter ATPase [Bacillota bacterium]
MPIQVKNLTHIYSEGMPYQTVALEDISFEIDDGSFVGIIGHTGSGKSTLIQHLNGLLKPKSGSIIVDGVDITDPSVSLRDIRKTIGLVFQYPEYQLFEETVEKDVAFGPQNLGLPEEVVSERVKEALELVGLSYEKIGKRSPFDLSGGQKRRVAIAGVIAMKPKVLILDEPTAGLDPKAHKDILRLIRNVQREEKITIILVSHNMGDIAALSEKVLVMHKGRLVMEGTPREVFSRAEQLMSIGLQLPPALQFTEALRQRGIELSGMPLTIDEVEREIAAWIGKKEI